ncbi:MAG TPA: 3-oxoacyl-[acyl-carrier-protein] synthase III C-terminal domain-containing protein [Thermoanaerobaculia bacterium]|nr:3-oxoacyl-[acyl-carrier-protein] synthase III C-terminal domain-containing protein [Thermoanaerobaculia bacterium]
MAADDDNTPRIASVGAAFPPHYYDQERLIEAFRALWGKRHHNLDRIERLHRNVLVGGRHLALPLEEYVQLDSWGKANDAWIRVAQEVGAEAVRDALARAGLTTDDVAALYTVTVTGVATPSLDARLINRLRLPTATKRVPIFGLGCLAGAAGVARAADYLAGHPDEVVVLLSVELCSLTLQPEDLSVPNLIASGLFGDGAAAVVLVGAARAAQMTEADAGAAAASGPSGPLGPRVLASASSFYYDTERVMGWDISEKGFQVVLSAEVPEMVRRHLRTDVDAFLAAQRLTRADIASWVAHPGGPKVLEAMQEELELPEEALAVTWRGLREVGNLSSTSVLLVLQETMAKHRPSAGSYGLLLAMGPGFCSELVLLQW